MKMSRADRFKLSEEAALWLVRLEQDPSAQNHGEFFEWARQSPRHMEEFMFARAVSTQLERMDPERRIEIDHAALAALDDDPVEALDAGANRESLIARSWVRRLPVTRKRRWVTGLAAALVAALTIALLGMLSSSVLDPARTYVTSTGDQQSVKLADGSLMQLNTKSRAEVSFSDAARQVRLIEGEALFVVAQDRARPFRVIAGAAVIQALGTQFNVYTRAEGTRISVVEGIVQVSRPARGGGGGLAEAVRLEAGAEVDITAGRIIEGARPDIERALAWRARRLVFHSDRLDHVIQEFNRYNRVRLRLSDPAIADRRISGVFEADDPQPLIDFLAKQPDFSVQMGREIVIGLRHMNIRERDAE